MGQRARAAQAQQGRAQEVLGAAGALQGQLEPQTAAEATGSPKSGEPWGPSHCQGLPGGSHGGFVQFRAQKWISQSELSFCRLHGQVCPGLAPCPVCHGRLWCGSSAVPRQAGAPWAGHTGCPS